MIVFLGLVVMFIVIAVLYPIYGLVTVFDSNSAGGGAGIPGGK